MYVVQAVEDKWPPLGKYFYNRDTDWLQAESDAYRSMRKLFFFCKVKWQLRTSLWKSLTADPGSGGGAT